MKALTIWQPWASLVMIGAKPYEFRKWDFTERPALAALVGQRVVIHAGSRPVKPAEIVDLMERIEAGESSLDKALALPLLDRIRAANKGRGVVELAAGLGTVTIGKPRRVTEIYAGHPDSDRLDEHMFGWPMVEPQRFTAPVPMRGFQGFWNWGAAA